MVWCNQNLEQVLDDWVTDWCEIVAACTYKVGSWMWDHRRLYKQGFNSGHSMFVPTLPFSCREMVSHHRILVHSERGQRERWNAIVKVTNLFPEVKQNEHFIFSILQKGNKYLIRSMTISSYFPQNEIRHILCQHWTSYISETMKTR
jgi:hypothetical protein